MLLKLFEKIEKIISKWSGYLLGDCPASHALSIIFISEILAFNTN
jgi:hypothetical protein